MKSASAALISFLQSSSQFLYADLFTVTLQPNGVQVNLAGLFNLTTAIANDGSFFSGSGGIDGVGNAYSETLLGSTITLNGVLFNFGPPNTFNAVRNTTVALPSGTFSALLMLGTAVQGNQLNQVVQVNYTDGSHDTFVQNFSDWFTPQFFRGETIASYQSYRNRSTGAKDNEAFQLYLYSFSINPSKIVSSVVLPSNINVSILAMTLVGNAASSGSEIFYYTNSDRDIVYNSNTYRSGSSNAGVNLVPDSDGFDLDWTFASPITYSGSGGANGGGKWSVLGTGSSSGLNFVSSVIFPVVPNQVYILSGYVDASQVTSSPPQILLTDPTGVTVYGSFQQTSGVNGRISTVVIIPQGVTQVIFRFATNNAVINNAQNLVFSNPQLEVLVLIPTVTDAFLRPILGPNWTTVEGSFAVSGGFIGAASFGADVIALADYTAFTFSNNQFAQLSLAAAPTANQLCVAVRVSGNSCYLFSVTAQISGFCFWTINKLVAGSFSTLASSSSTLPNPRLGDVFSIAIVGTQLLVFINNQLVTSVTDATLASGSPGLLSFSPFPVQLGTDFGAGNVGPTPYSSTTASPLMERDTVSWKTGLEVDTLAITAKTINNPAYLTLGAPFLQDLSVGKLDNALISVDRLYMQFPGDTSLGTVNIFKGNVGDISELGRTMAKLEVKSKVQKLNTQMPFHIFQPNCRWTLYDQGCTLVKANFGVNGVVQSGASTRIQTTGGSSILKYQISLGTGVAGTTYTASVLVKNQGPTAVTVNMNAGSATLGVVNPGQTLQLKASIFETGNNCGIGVPCSIQLRFNTANAGDAMDILAVNPGLIQSSAALGSNGVNLIPVASQTFAGSWAAFSGAVATLTQNMTGVLNTNTPVVLVTNLNSTDGIFNQGTITFTSGQNNGLTRSVRLWQQAPQLLTLYLGLPFVPAIGDTFTVYRGCAKTESACNSFNNIQNFSGEPFVPIPETGI